MIKFFRKIRQNLLMENKTGKYFKYAIGEIVLVMIGILLALQVNNWNNERKDRVREVKYLQNIKQDLEKDLNSLAFQINFRREKYKTTNKLIAQINGAPITDITELTYNVVNTLMEEKFTPNNTTYTELSNSGNLNLISNDSIKKFLLDLEELYKRNDFSIEHETFDYREYISKPLLKYINTNKLWPVYLGDKTIEDQNITMEDFNELLKNKEYFNGIFISNIITETTIPSYKNIKIKSTQLIKMINNELIELK